MIDPSDAREKRQSAMKQEGSAQLPANTVQRDLLMPALTSINNRIYTYEQKLEEWKTVEGKLGSVSLPSEKAAKINECKAQLHDILADYNALHQQLLQKNRVDSAQLLVGDSLFELNQQDINYLEGGCGRLLAELKATPGPAAATAVAAVDPQIKAAFDSADYDRVITLYGQTMLAPGMVPAYETTYQYGLALLKNHQESMARQVFVDLLARVRPQQGQDALTFPLMQVIGDMDFSMESYDEARRRYEELVRLSIERGYKEEWAGLQLAALQPGSTPPAEIKEYSVLLKNYLAYTPKRDGYAVSEQAEKFLFAYPASRMVPSVNLIHKTSREQAEAWLNQGIKRIEALAGERKSQEAPVTGEQIPANNPPPDTKDGVKSGEQAASIQVAAVDEKVLGEDFDKGMKQLEAKEYDKAIESFTRLLNTSYEERARTRIEEAARLGAQEDRQKAADLFVRSNATRDQENKKKLLLSSRQLLQGILVKYPQSGLTDKVQKNLSRIEEELKAVGSSPSSVPASRGGAYVPPGGPPPVSSANNL